jgi:hypothetical protein
MIGQAHEALHGLDGIDDVPFTPMVALGIGRCGDLAALTLRIPDLDGTAFAAPGAPAPGTLKIPMPPAIARKIAGALLEIADAIEADEREGADG